MSAQVGFVYILVNRYMPGIYKVGCTERSPHERAEELSKGSGVPYPYTVLCYVELPAFQSAERALHDWLIDHRVSRTREFFEDEIERAFSFLWWHPKRLTRASPQIDVPGWAYFEHANGDAVQIDLSVDVWAPKIPSPSTQSPQGFDAFLERAVGHAANVGDDE